jgi:cysteine-rich repeat protein
MLTRLTLLFTGSLAAGCFLSGCDDVDDGSGRCGDDVLDSSEQCDDGNLTDGDGCSASCGQEGAVSVTWRFTDATGATLPCPAGFDQAQLSGFESSSVTGRNFTFPCESGQASLMVFRARYDATVVIKSGATGEVWGSSLPEPVDLSTADRTVAATLRVDAGYLRLSWGFADAAGAGIPCGLDEQATVTLTPEIGIGDPIVETIGCADNVTRPLLPGTYTGSVSARGRTAPLPTSVTIEPRNKLTSFGPVSIRLD